MYDMKGLQAATVFHNAAIKWRTYLKRTTIPETVNMTVSTMEKSIFWSCLKQSGKGAWETRSNGK